MPTGADVYVMGAKVGTTPLKIEQKDVFPNSYPKEKESLYGKVTLRKAGCADYTKTINAKIVDVGLKAKLDCGSMNPPAAQGGAIVETRSAPAPRVSKTVEQRLQEIKALLDKGLITEDEAKNARERVLNDL